MSERGINMKVFAIGDLHLGFNADKPMDIFGDRWWNHSIQLDVNWRKYISMEDIILIPGDISWAMRLNEAHLDLQWLNQLPGKKICVKGNHDYWWDRPKKLNTCYENIVFLQNDAYLLGDLAICGTRGWNSPTPVFTDDDVRLY